MQKRRLGAVLVFLLPTCLFTSLARAKPHKLKLQGGVVQAHQNGWVVAGGGVTLAGTGLALSAAALVGNLSDGHLGVMGPAVLSTSDLLLSAATLSLELDQQRATAQRVKVAMGAYALKADWLTSQEGQRRLGGVTLTARDPRMARRGRVSAPLAQLTPGGKLKLKNPAFYLENTKLVRLPKLALRLADVQALAQGLGAPGGGQGQKAAAAGAWAQTDFGPIGQRGLSLRHLTHLPLGKRPVGLLAGGVLSAAGDNPPPSAGGPKAHVLGVAGVSVKDVSLLWGRDFFVDELSHAHLTTLSPFAYLRRRGGQDGRLWQWQLAGGRVKEQGAGFGAWRKLAHNRLTGAWRLKRRGPLSLWSLVQLNHTRYGGALAPGAPRFFETHRVELKLTHQNLFAFGHYLEAGARWTLHQHGAPATGFEGADESTRWWAHTGVPFRHGKWRVAGFYAARKGVAGHDVRSVELQKNYALYHLFARYSFGARGFTMGFRLNQSEFYQPALASVLDEGNFWSWR